VKAGDWLIAIGGREVKAGDNHYAYLEDTVGHAVEVTYNSRPTLDGASSCTVEPIASEYRIREREWVEANRAKVDEMSGGAIGYLYLPDMMEDGLIQFARDWYPQYRKRAIIIDERYNGGGFVADMIIDVLERRLWSLTKPREGMVLTDPERTFHGHLAVLINGDTGSNGEYFAEAIKRKGLATVIGSRTWGGAVGIEPHQDLVDGGTATPPQFGAYSTSRTCRPTCWRVAIRSSRPRCDICRIGWRRIRASCRRRHPTPTNPSPARVSPTPRCTFRGQPADREALTGQPRRAVAAEEPNGWLDSRPPFTVGGEGG
jgi:hypothetical protein